MLFKNTLIEWLSESPESAPRVERILCVDAAQGVVATIEVFDKSALPVLRGYEEIRSALATQVARTLEADPYASLLRAESEIPEKHRERRDRAWRLIEGIVSEGIRAFDKSVRGRLVARAAVNSGSAKKVIYGYLRRYWQGGQVKNALLPGFDRCGGQGKRRLGKDKSETKLGRRSHLSRAMGGRPSGIRITKEIERLFERGIRRFYETLEKKNLADAFQQTLEAFFHTGFKIEAGVPVPVMPPAGDLPTFKQFRYWYHNIYRDVVREKKAREGERGFNLRSRAITGDSTQMAFGPGSIFQIDATIADVYLVSAFDRSRIIGRPVVYIVIDVFSRLIVGLAVTLEGPSWLGAMLALDNVVADKVAFCAEYGITIREEQWPCRHLPEAIFADRGEFEGYNADTLVNALGIRVHNTPPYRADEKGIVERSFGSANETTIHFVPGAVIKARERGERDYRLDAVLTLDEFRALMIAHVLDHNANRYLSSYRKDEFMIAGHVERYPLDLWNWGVRNRSGHLAPKPRDIVRLNLLPHKQVSVTAQGIRFERDLYYTCDLAVREGWFERARDRGSWKVSAAYDPRSMSAIYLPLAGGRELEMCHLTPAAQAFKSRDWHEAMDYFSLETQAAELARSRQYQSRAALHAHQNQIVSEAKRQTETARILAGPQSKRARVKDIRSNRLQEREAERAQGAWRLGDAKHSPASTKPDAPAEAKKDAYVPPSSKIARLREVRNRKWGK